MTLTVSMNRVGIVRATEILHQARADAARQHETWPQTVSVELDRPPAPDHEDGQDRAPGQSRVVDIRI